MTDIQFDQLTQLLHCGFAVVLFGIGFCGGMQ